jgi:hypothetical protein
MVMEAATEIEALRRENRGLRNAVIEECAKIADIKANEYDDEGRDLRNYDSDRRFSAAVAVRYRACAAAIRALTMSDIHREQIDRPRIKPADIVRPEPGKDELIELLAHFDRLGIKNRAAYQKALEDFRAALSDDKGGAE